LEVIYSHEPPHYTLTKDHVEQKKFHAIIHMH
jgi:hypothetical protein